MSATQVAQGVAAVATVASTASQIQQNAAQANADTAMGRAAIQEAAYEEQADRRKSAAIIAKQEAGAAAAGLDVGSGTPLELKLDSAFNAEMNALQIRKSGQYKKFAYKSRAAGLRAQTPGLIFSGISNLAANYLTYGGSTALRTPRRNP